jgi:hypothetical protein
MIHKRILLIDDADVSDILKALKRKAKVKNINLDFDQFNVGSQRLPELITDDGKLDISKVIKYYNSHYERKYFDIIACDYQLSVDNVDGPDLLRQIGTQCFAKGQRFLIYSSLLESIIEEHVQKSCNVNGKKFQIDKQLLKYIRHLVNAQYIGFVDREDLVDTLLNHLLDHTSLENLLEEAVEKYPDMVLKYGFNHHLEGKKLKDCLNEIYNNDTVRNDVMRDLFEQTLIYLCNNMSIKQ